MGPEAIFPLATLLCVMLKSLRVKQMKTPKGLTLQG